MVRTQNIMGSPIKDLVSISNQGISWFSIYAIQNLVLNNWIESAASATMMCDT